ncbi:ATP-dependent nuclease [Bacillota bacterium Meth-B3]
MILSKLKLWNFRKFNSKESIEPGLEVCFHKGLNALIGENDSGKSTIIDAIKLVLQTQSGEYIRITDDDFYTANGTSVSEFRIECTFEEFKPEEAKNFIEWLTFYRKAEGEEVCYKLTLRFRAWKEKNRIFTELKAGNSEDGVQLDGKARELLKCTYLRPLRDASREMNSGRNTRISQILYSHPTFSNREGHKLVEIFSDANEKVEKYFTEEEGIDVLGTIRSILQEFRAFGEPDKVSFEAAGVSLKSILENLSLAAPEVQPGLGLHNLLFIAAELLLLNHDENGGLRLALIEELEAHLHPQAQLRLIAYLQREYNNSGVQIIVSTHSTILASKINIKNLILCKNGTAYDLTPEKTQLEKGDYLFLQRFLDATKANLFFANGIIMVEGDAENLLIPTIADIIGLNLEKHGVSLVNVGSIAFFRFANIFKQTSQKTLGIPISIVTDCDIKPVRNSDGTIDSKEKETIQAVHDITERYNLNEIKAFVAPNWTLEYTLALSNLRVLMHQSILFAKKIENSNKYALTSDKVKDAIDIAKKEMASWKESSTERRHHVLHYQGRGCGEGVRIMAHIRGWM